MQFGNILTAWITKRALTKGIEELEVMYIGHDSVSHHTGSFVRYFHKNEWHITEYAAILRANEMKRKKIALLKKQIAKLEAMKFKINDQK